MRGAAEVGRERIDDPVRPVMRAMPKAIIAVRADDPASTRTPIGAGQNHCLNEVEDNGRAR